MNSETHCPFCKKPFTPEEIAENDRAEGQFLQDLEQTEVANVEYVDDGLVDRLWRQPRQGAE